MTIAAWPATLPSEPLRNGFVESHPTMIIRTAMDNGPAKVRRLKSKASRPISLSFVMTPAQVEIFETFVKDTIAEGVYRFSFDDPRTDVSSEFRLVPTQQELYSIVPLAENTYKINCKMEMLP